MNITRSHIKNLVDEPYLSRGEEYFEDGLVQLISVSESSVKSRVVGTRIYKVVITLQGEKLDGDCSCPAFDDFGPCKHMAATLFAVMAVGQGTYHPSKRCIRQTAENDRIERLLTSKTKKELVDLIMEVSQDYPELLDVLEEEDLYT